MDAEHATTPVPGPAAGPDPAGAAAAAALALLAQAVGERLGALRAPFLAAAGTARDQATALLGSDADQRRGGPAPAALAAALGGLAARHLDPAGLSQVLGSRSHGAPLSATRRRRLEAALADLAAAWQAQPVLVTLPAEPLPTPAGFRRLESPTPLATATALRDEAMAALGRSLAGLTAIRRELEGQGESDAEAVLAPGWEDLAERRGLLTPVIAWVPESALRADGGAALLAVLAGSRALQVVTPFAPFAPVGDSWDPVLAAVGLRRVFVHEAALPLPGAPAGPAAAESLLAAFRHGLAAAGPALHRLAQPVATADAAGATAAAARAVTPLLCDPAAGEGWSRRLTLFGPAPAADWGTRSLRISRDDGATEVRDLPLTFADAALATATWSAAAQEAGSGEELVPLAEWLDKSPTTAAALTPWTWAAAADGGAPRKLALDQALAVECRRRLLRWRSLQELAGLRGEALAAAAESARSEEQEAARLERATLVTAHERELQALGQAAEHAAVDRLVSALLGVDAGALAAPDPFAAFRGRDAEEVAAALMAVVASPGNRGDA